jgi:hypothetical protein
MSQCDFCRLSQAVRASRQHFPDRQKGPPTAGFRELASGLQLPNWASRPVKSSKVSTRCREYSHFRETVDGDLVRCRLPPEGGSHARNPPPFSQLIIRVCAPQILCNLGCINIRLIRIIEWRLLGARVTTRKIAARVIEAETDCGIAPVSIGALAAVIKIATPLSGVPQSCVRM